MAKTNDTVKKKGGIPPEAKGLMLLAIAFVMLLSLLSFHPLFPEKNWLGLVGFGLGLGFSYLLGLTSYLLAAYLGWLGWKHLCNQPIANLSFKHVYFGIFIISTAILLNLMAENGIPIAAYCENKIYTESLSLDLPFPHRTFRYNLGGVPLYYLYRDLPICNLQHLLSDIGLGLTFSLTSLLSFLLLTEIQILPLFSVLCAKSSAWLKLLFAQKNKGEENNFKGLQDVQKKSAEEIESTLTKRYPQPIYSPHEPKIRLPADKDFSEPKSDPVRKKQAAIEAQKVYNGDFTSYKLPPASLLNNAKKVDQPTLKKDLKRQAEILEETLLSFGIEAKVGEIYCGPTITSFEVHPAVGVKVQKIRSMENDIALNVQAKSIRIIAPIPGKAAVGVEIPSPFPQEVSFKELLLNYQQNPRKMHIPLLLGKTVSGDNVISDLSKMPHLLIAGATGSGKSVCINTVVMSILMNARPDEIKLIMIDPKKVELTPYTALPHMIAPVITEAQGAYAALSWLVKEMQVRYEVLKQLGLRNITAFNNRHINKDLESSLSIPVPTRMYGIVTIIDEFADLMMASSSDLETPIARIAQMARAVGIHLILATQRPSREVITGLIKANFPTRITFKVSSRVNSQIIIDDNGAESLLGNGDMLFLPPGTSHLIRSQGAYISDDEILKVVSFISDQAPAKYLIESFDKMRPDPMLSDSEGDSARDNLYEQARTIVLDTKNASTTYLQRKLKIGYARAASLMDELEEKGVIGPQEGAKPRRILISDANAPILPNKKLMAYEQDQELFE